MTRIYAAYQYNIDQIIGQHLIPRQSLNKQNINNTNVKYF